MTKNRPGVDVGVGGRTVEEKRSRTASFRGVVVDWVLCVGPLPLFPLPQDRPGVEGCERVLFRL